MGKFVDISGQRFGRLIVIRRVGTSGKNAALWECGCECGTITTSITAKLRNGTKASCGCQVNKPIHGHTRRGGQCTPTYNSWKSMIGRCTYPSIAGFAHYKKLGITICDRWRNGDGIRGGFECFLADVGERPSLAYSLDRYPNPMGNYEPGNVRWATRREQANNRYTNRLFEYQGEMLTCGEIAQRTGRSRDLLRHRLIRAGWTVEDAINPQRVQGRNPERRLK